MHEESSEHIMKIGIGLPNQVRDVRADVIPTWAVYAERVGFSSLCTLGRTAYPGVADTVTLAAAAGATRSIGLLSSVAQGLTRAPVMLAKEAAGIDGVSGGRLTLGLGLGHRADDFAAAGLPATGLGRRFDHDLQVYHDVWSGRPVGGGSNPAVPAGTRAVPLLFGGDSAAAFARMARWGEGHIAGWLPAHLLGKSFETARAAWRRAGREGAPRLVALAYFALGDPERGRGRIKDYHAADRPQAAEATLARLAASEADARRIAAECADLGVDELVFNPALDDLEEVARLADAVL
jgi:alkanesulfonate monooxygenase SsuD/methylene tetrahydromethanopterin reductase-like flavin-dependent oxidoreductase (luciferase family)